MKELTKIFDGITIPIEYIDDTNMWFNVSGIASKYKKNITEWKESKRIKESIKLLEKSNNLSKDKFIISVGHSTKIHRSLFVSFARFISLKFEIAADKIIMDILLGKHQEVCEQFETKELEYKQDLFTLELKLADAKELKTYKDGQMSLRKYLKIRNLKGIHTEDEAWKILVNKNIVFNHYPKVLKRLLNDFSFGFQNDLHKSPAFIPEKLDEIFFKEKELF